MFALKMDSRNNEPAVFGLGYIKISGANYCAVCEFGQDNIIQYTYPIQCDDGKYLIDAAFTDVWKVNPADTEEESSIVAIDDHYQFDGSTHKQSIYFMSRFKTS